MGAGHSDLGCGRRRPHADVITLWNGTGGEASIYLQETTVELSAPPDLQLTLERDLDDVFYAIGFADGELVFVASPTGGDWRELAIWSDPFTDPVGIALAVGADTSIADFTIAGINTPATGLDCP